MKLADTQARFHALVTARDDVAAMAARDAAVRATIDAMVVGDDRLSAVERLGVYATMYFVVLPLSRVGMPHYRHLGPPLDEILIHIFGVGIPAAFFVRAAGPGSPSGS